jgi:monothiol glutaredoxin
MPSRPRLDDRSLSPAALAAMDAFHADVIREVREVVQRDTVVVFGMATNVHVKRVRKALEDAGVPHTYMEYGGYLSKWRERLAIKLWSGWPTFPQVFVRGVLLGGEVLTKAAIADGSLQASLSGGARVPAVA